MDKSPDAFRTISEVSEWLDTPAHVLRFWESRFSQVKPVKRAGGRRYYRPSDMRLLGGIKKLLHEDGVTIRGVQKILREQGVKSVAALSQPLDTDDIMDDDLLEEAPMMVDVQPEETTGEVIELTQPSAQVPPKAEDPESPEAPPLDATDETLPQTETQMETQAVTPVETAPEPEQSDEPELDFAPAPAPAEPLGTDLPQNDPADDEIPEIRPVTVGLRANRGLDIGGDAHGAMLHKAMERLTALRDRMDRGE